jgi:hypothetical protein
VARTERSTAHLAGRREQPEAPKEFKKKPKATKKPAKPWDRMPRRKV